MQLVVQVDSGRLRGVSLEPCGLQELVLRGLVRTQACCFDRVHSSRLQSHQGLPCKTLTRSAALQTPALSGLPGLVPFLDFTMMQDK